MIIINEDLGKLKIDQLKKEIKSSYGLNIENCEENGIEVMDDIWGRLVIFNNLEKLNMEKLFRFNSAKIDTKKFFEIVKNIDKQLFLNVREIIFINNEKEYNKLVEEYDFDLLGDFENNIGRWIFLEGIIVINMYAIIHSLKNDFLYVTEFIDEVNIGMWTTLIHELRHSYQANPLIEDYFKESSVNEREDDAEIYCRKEFDQWIYRGIDYQVLTNKKSLTKIFNNAFKIA